MTEANENEQDGAVVESDASEENAAPAESSDTTPAGDIAAVTAKVDSLAEMVTNMQVAMTAFFNAATNDNAVDDDVTTVEDDSVIDDDLDDILARGY